MNICNTETLTEYIAAVFLPLILNLGEALVFRECALCPDTSVKTTWVSTKTDHDYTPNLSWKDQKISTKYFSMHCYVYWNNDFTTSSRNREPFCCFILWRRSPSLQNSITMYRWPSSAVWVRPDREYESEISHHVWV